MEKAKNSCCLLLKGNNTDHSTAQGILCRLINNGANIGPQFGLLTCHHVIPSMAETLGWTIYYGRGQSFKLEPSIIENFYSCCNKESDNEHFCMDCHVDLDFTFIEFNERATIRRDIELFDLKGCEVNLEGRCCIYKRDWNIRTRVDHEDHNYAFCWEGDQSNFAIQNPKIGGHGTSGCPVVFLPPDGEPHLLGMHTLTTKNDKGNFISVNVSIVWIIKLLKVQKKVVETTYQLFLQIFSRNYKDSENVNRKQILWTIANRLCVLQKRARLLHCIDEFCKCISNCCLGFTITFYL